MKLPFQVRQMEHKLPVPASTERQAAEVDRQVVPTSPERLRVLVDKLVGRSCDRSCMKPISQRRAYHQPLARDLCGRSLSCSTAILKSFFIEILSQFSPTALNLRETSVNQSSILLGPLYLAPQSPLNAPARISAGTGRTCSKPVSRVIRMVPGGSRKPPLNPVRCGLPTNQK